MSKYTIEEIQERLLSFAREARHQELVRKYPPKQITIEEANQIFGLRNNGGQT